MEASRANARLGPPSIQEFAVHMRDETWLDVRIISRGVLERVRIFELVIRRESEELGLIQCFVRGDETHRVEHRIDPEDVIWARRSMFDLEDVKAALPSDTPPSVEELRRAILDTVLFWRGITQRELFSEHHGNRGRYYCMRLMWEFSTVSLDKIPPMFSTNKSGGVMAQALNSNDPQHQPERAKQARELKELVELRLGKHLRPVPRQSRVHSRLFGDPS